MSNSVPKTPSKTNNIVEAAPAAAGLTAGGLVWAYATKAALAGGLAAVTAFSTLASGSYLPTVASATLTGLDVATGFPVVRTGTAVAAGLTAIAGTQMALKLGRASAEIFQRAGSAAKAVANTITGSANRPVVDQTAPYEHYRIA